jgi:hypothetical protein
MKNESKKDNPKTSEKPTWDQLTATFYEWEEIAYDEKDEFVEKFCPEAWTLTSVSWNSEKMNFVYVLDSGQHVANSVKISEWFKFLESDPQLSENKTNDELKLPNDNSVHESLHREIAALMTEKVKLHAECQKYRIALNRIAAPETWGINPGHHAEIARRALILGLKVDPLPDAAKISQ